MFVQKPVNVLKPVALAAAKHSFGKIDSFKKFNQLFPSPIQTPFRVVIVLEGSENFFE
jgi:hypothetical protein